MDNSDGIIDPLKEALVLEQIKSSYDKISNLQAKSISNLLKTLSKLNALKNIKFQTRNAVIKLYREQRGNMKNSNKELEILLWETVTFNQETLETLELLVEELDSSLCLNLTQSTMVAH